MVPFVNYPWGDDSWPAINGGTGNESSGIMHKKTTSQIEAATPKPMRVDAMRNHEKILQAAEETFALEGVMVPIDIVAERAGVGIGTLYRHFPTKEALYEAIVMARLTALLTRADEYARDPDAGQALYSYLREFAAQAAEKRDLFEALSQAGIDVKAQFSSLIEELMAKVDALRVRAVNSGAIRGDVATKDILNLVVGSCHVAGQSGFDDAGLDRLIDIVIAGIQPPIAR
jgi:AcrR family transcriptional regulator